MADHSLIAAQARQLVAAGRAEQARTTLARALQKAGADADLNLAMAEALAALGQRSQAAYYAAAAARSRPDDASVHMALGTHLIADNRLDEAIVALERAVRLAPDQHAARINLASTLLLRERYADALHHARAAADAGFSHPFLSAALASSLRCLGRVEEAMPVIRAGLAAFPDDGMLTEALASALNFLPGAAPQEPLAAHRARAGQIERAIAQVAAAARIRPAAPPTPSDADRPLRIGLLSPDLRSHSVAFFVEPLLRHVDRALFQTTCYFTGSPATQDDTSRRLASLSGAWRECHGLDDPALARQVRSDGIDILIELSGHSNGHRLGTMALRPAPLQLSYCGYPNTTGLRAIDGRIVDSRTDPAPEADSLATERLLRLDPCFLCYQPPAEAPPPAGRVPAPGSVVFGSFNNMQKINARVVRVWAAILGATPGSRLVLKSPGLRQESAREAIVARFAEHGIDPSRVEALPPTRGLAEHLANYERMDLALDTFPYCGTTTTCEALLMGVPVVSLVGSVHAARVGLSLLSAAGLPELAATDEAGYIQLAVDLATQPARLSAVRGAALREHLLASPLCNGPDFGSRFGALLRRAWIDRCNARAPAADAGGAV